MVYALLSVAFWGVLDGGLRVAIVGYGADPYLVSTGNLLLGGLVLWAVGDRRAARGALRYWETWAFGGCRYAVGILLAYVSWHFAATEVDFLCQTAAAMLVLWDAGVQRRWPTLGELALVALLCGGAAWVGFSQPGLPWWSLPVVGAAALCYAASVVLAARNPANQRAVTPAERAGLTGMVLIVCALPFLLAFPFVGPPLDTVNWASTLGWALGIGLLTRVPSMGFYLVAAKHLGAKRLVLVFAVMWMVTLSTEWAASMAGVADMRAMLTPTDLAVGVAMTLGSVWMALKRRA
ncbi:MAG: hypothetical protein H6739_29890 [Alphaproteobacteria bacterium]|nr:hypothetical protein [Alphaproteobacteria bacterium]